MRLKIIDQVKEMDVDLFESIVNEFLKTVDTVVNIRINTNRDFLLRATIIYKSGNC